MRNAFTSLEVLLSIAIMGIVAGVIIPSYRDYLIRNDLHLAAEQITQALARAQLLAQAGKDASAWGFAISDGVLFQGEDFAARNTYVDEVFPIPSTVTVSGLLEVSFSPLQGIPSATGTILLTSLRGERRTISITLDRQGIPIITDDRLTICHRKPNPPHTLHIPEPAWPAHRGHGDTMGAC